MATYTGTSGAVYVDTAEVGEVRDFSLEQSAEVVASTTMGDSWVENKATLKAFNASVNMFWTGGTDNQDDFVLGTEIAFVLYPTGNTTGQKKIAGQAIVTSISQSQSFDGLIELSISVTGTGALAETTVT
jgi:hypothetical protein